jgi:two-component system CheB/CheR fusion protein
MSGLEVTRHLRADRSFRDTLIIALTGYGHPEDHARSRAAGFDLHLTKPVDLERLRRLLQDPVLES